MVEREVHVKLVLRQLGEAARGACVCWAAANASALLRNECEGVPQGSDVVSDHPSAAIEPG